MGAEPLPQVYLNESIVFLHLHRFSKQSLFQETLAARRQQAYSNSRGVGSLSLILVSALG